MSMQEFSIGPWRITPNQNRLKKSDGTEQSLDAKSMDVLVLLLQANGDVVLSETLLDTVWKDRVVEPGILHQKIRAIRSALGDDAKEPIYIETVHKRGYRVLALEPSEALEVPETARSLSALVLWGTSIVLVLVVAWAFWSGALSSRDPADMQASSASVENAPLMEGSQRVAVLPLRDLSPNGGYDWLAGGVTAELQSQIGNWNRFEVVPNAVSRNWKIDSADADIVLDGFVQGVGNNVEIGVEVINAASQRYVWSDRFSGQDTDPLALQKRIAAQIARHFGESIGEVQGPQNPHAYRAFLKYLNYRLFGDLEKEVYWLKQALDHDPSWGRGWADLSIALYRVAALQEDPDLAAKVPTYLANAKANASFRGNWFMANSFRQFYWDRDFENGLTDLGRELSRQTWAVNSYWQS